MKHLLILAVLAWCQCFAQVPGVTAKSYIVTDLSGNVLLERDSHTARSIASITKLLIAEQITGTHPGLITILPEDLASKRTKLKVNSHVSEAELLEMALIPSNNQAIYALTRSHDSTVIIANVNDAAKSRGLSSIVIEEPSGLNLNNKASAEDLAKFIVLIRNTHIANVSIIPLAKTSVGEFRSTNPLLGKPGWNFEISKTGFINASGGCIATMVEIGGQQRIVIILGSSNTKTRWQDLIKIRSFLASSDSFWTPGSKKKFSHLGLKA
jgi:D-alanyl-D-alanine carboxypeptidase